MREGLDPDATPDAAFVAISVQDTGTGMPDEVKERAFEPFFTTKEAGRGTGLGLSTVYGFAKQSKGAIAIDSAPGAGTTVTLYIPSVRTTAATQSDRGETSEIVPQGLHVLLVEDDSEVRAVVNTFLHALGCEVTACSRGEQAVLALPPMPGSTCC
ncbi:MAG: ATP-binding protein [Pseudomonadota bacterium]|nr:ATP-binding protein [Pseudomonadota bacterium]